MFRRLLAKSMHLAMVATTMVSLQQQEQQCWI
jgi:hypothetical protein